jgi:hypothetical protein
MASRNELVLRACKANVDHTLAKYQNDSVLEQALIFAEQASTATSTATTLVANVQGLRVAGGKNV